MAKLAPSVEKPRSRVRPGLVIALAGTMTLSILVPFALRQNDDPIDVSGPDPASELRTHCTPLEATLYLQHSVLPIEQRATCLAIAGKIDNARELFRAMTPAESNAAISTIFEIAHPIADAGDDRSAGPIMGLVVEIWPQNYMAMFHAGMAQYALGNDTAATSYLERFLAMYRQRDVWRQRAEAAIVGIRAQVPLARREAHFAE